jgi:hypothetical protein
MGNVYTGIIFITINNDYAPGSNGEIYNSIPICNNVPTVQSFCSHNGMPFVTFINNINDVLEVNTFPSFGLLQQGEVKVLIPNFNSTFDGSTIESRDINAYVPSSISQNTLNRPINIIVVNDGSLDEVKTYVFNGFELGQQTGVVPESIDWYSSDW